MSGPTGSGATEANLVSCRSNSSPDFARSLGVELVRAEALRAARNGQTTRTRLTSRCAAGP